MIWRSKYSLTNNASGTGETGMGLVFLVDEGLDFGLMIGEVAKRVEDLGLAQSQRFRDVSNSFSALMERDHMPDRYAEAIDDGLASANPRMAHNMRVLGLD